MCINNSLLAVGDVVARVGVFGLKLRQLKQQCADTRVLLVLESFHHAGEVCTMKVFNVACTDPCITHENHCFHE